jgi:hypothetical protein
MSKVKFTKGEWSIEKNINQIHIISSFDENNKAICSVSAYGSNDNSIREANASLIKTSPKMYDMLEKIINLIENLPDNAIGEVEDTPDTQGWFIKDEVVHNISNLLSEARGEQ